MRFFFDTSQRPERSQFRVRETPSYYELETLSSDPGMPGASYVYVLPQSQSSVIVAACWGREPDATVALLQDPKFGADWAKAIGRAFPLQAVLFANGDDERYADGALVRFPDPDDGEPKWSVITIVGNLRVGAPPEDLFAPNDYDLPQHLRFLEHPRLAAAYELVMTKSFLAAHEIAVKEISLTDKARLLAKGAWQGYSEALASGATWVTRLSGLPF